MTNREAASYRVDPKRLDLAGAVIRFYRAPSAGGISRHYAVIAIPHSGDQRTAPFPLFLTLNSASNWSVVRARRIWHAINREDQRPLERSLEWLTRASTLPSDEYSRAALPWYLDPRKQAGMMMLLELVRTFSAISPWDVEYRSLTIPAAAGQTFAFDAPKAGGRATPERLVGGAHRIRVLAPDGTPRDLYGSDRHLKQLLSSYVGARQPKLRFYCCVSTLQSLGLSAPRAAVERLGAEEAFRRGLAPRKWDRHGDSHATYLPRG